MAQLQELLRASQERCSEAMERIGHEDENELKRCERMTKKWQDIGEMLDKAVAKEQEDEFWVIVFVFGLSAFTIELGDWCEILMWYRLLC